MLLLLSIVSTFHLGVIIKIFPYDIAWGGHLKNDNEMYAFEVMSIFINLVLMAVILLKGGYLKFQLHRKIVNTVLWVFFFVFILNTIGNILSDTNFEKSLSILTLILAVLIWNILKEKDLRTTNL